jgi:hypothetical protein
VVVLAKWPDRDEQKYYDAEVVSADRKDHGPGEGHRTTLPGLCWNESCLKSYMTQQTSFVGKYVQ